jgi:hypothetical protein
MNWIETAVRWRHGTFVLFCLLAVFGVISLLGLPLELQPGGDRPEITITTAYPGAAPAEVEDLVTRPLEEVLEQVPGVQEVKSASRAGTSSISLEFAWGDGCQPAAGGRVEQIATGGRPAPRSRSVGCGGGGRQQCPDDLASDGAPGGGSQRPQPLPGFAGRCGGAPPAPGGGGGGSFWWSAGGNGRWRWSSTPKPWRNGM